VWERSFVAVSVLLGEPGPRSVDDALAALPDGAERRLAELTTKLRDPRRPVRAQGLAMVAQEIAVAIGEATLRASAGPPQRHEGPR
jgi:hypothetical protein